MTGGTFPNQLGNKSKYNTIHLYIGENDKVGDAGFVMRLLMTPV